MTTAQYVGSAPWSVCVKVRSHELVLSDVLCRRQNWENVQTSDVRPRYVNLILNYLLHGLRNFFLHFDSVITINRRNLAPPTLPDVLVTGR